MYVAHIAVILLILLLVSFVEEYKGESYPQQNHDHTVVVPIGDMSHIALTGCEPDSLISLRKVLRHDPHDHHKQH